MTVEYCYVNTVVADDLLPNVAGHQQILATYVYCLG